MQFRSLPWVFQNLTQLYLGENNFKKWPMQPNSEIENLDYPFFHISPLPQIWTSTTVFSPFFCHAWEMVGSMEIEMVMFFLNVNLSRVRLIAESLQIFAGYMNTSKH